MTDQHRHQSLDERGRAAGRDVLDVAARRTRPAFAPDRPTDLQLGAVRAPAPRRRAVAAAAALVLVAGVAVFATGRDGGDTTPTMTTGSPRPFVATDLPEGFTFLGAAPDAAPQDGQFGPVTVYGPTADEPLLGLFVATGLFDDVTIVAEVVVVDGVEAEVTEEGTNGATVLVEVGTDTVLATSPALDPEVLVRLAREAVADGSTARLADRDLPDGWRQLDVDPAGAPISPLVAWQIQQPVGDTSVYGAGLESGYVTVEGDDGRYVDLGGEVDEDDGSSTASSIDAGPTLVAVSTLPGDEARLHAATLWVGDVTEVEVRGRRALTGTDGFEGQESRLLTWQESPGEIVRMWGTQASLDDLTDLAEALEPVDDDAWDDLVDRTRLGDFAPGPPGETREVVGEGTFDDGTAWVLRVVSSSGYDTPNLMVAAVTGREGSSSSASGFEVSTGGASGGALLGYEVTEAAGRTFVAGLVGDDVAAVEVLDLGGNVLARPEIVEGSGRRGWAVEITTGDGDDTVEVVALGGDGGVVERSVMGNGAVEITTEPATPDPEGPAG